MLKAICDSGGLQVDALRRHEVVKIHYTFLINVVWDPLEKNLYLVSEF